MSNNFSRPPSPSLSMLLNGGLHGRMEQRLVMTPELSADTNTEAEALRAAVRNRYKLAITLPPKDESGSDK